MDNVLSDLAGMMKGPASDAGTGKIPLEMLPVGVKPGQRVSLTVVGIDPLTGMATVVPDAVQNAVPEGPQAGPQAMPMDSIDKSLTMGPMDGLKSYLFQKTQEQQEKDNV